MVKDGFWFRTTSHLIQGNIKSARFSFDIEIVNLHKSCHYGTLLFCRSTLMWCCCKNTPVWHRVFAEALQCATRLLHSTPIMQKCFVETLKHAKQFLQVSPLWHTVAADVLKSRTIIFTEALRTVSLVCNQKAH